MSTKLTAHDKKDLPAADKLPDATRRRREHFLPIRKPDLVRLILSDERLATNEIADLNSICHRLDALIHLRFHGLLSQLKAAYAPCDPDAVSASQVQPWFAGLMATYASPTSQNHQSF